MGGSLFEDGGSHKVGPNQKLGVSHLVKVSVRVERELKEQRSPNSPKAFFLDKNGVEILEKGVSEFEIDLGGGENCVSKGIWLLGN